MAKILVVDDEPDMIWAITNVLLSENHSVVSVNSGEEALQKVREAPLDLVLLDFRLPGMDGIQILENIRQIKPALPVVMVTGYGGIEEAVQAIKLGAAHYIAKPFDNDHLVEIVNKSLQLDSLKKEGVFGKRIAEKIDPQLQKSATEPVPETSTAPAVTPKKKNGKFFVAGIAGLMAVLAVGSWFLLKDRDKEYVIPHSHVSGLSWGGGTLWVCDWFTQSIYQYQIENNELHAIRVFPVKGEHLTGIAWSEGSLYTCDSWKKTITRRRLDGSLSVAQVVPSPGPNPSGLFFDGKYLWSCDGNNRKIYQHALDDQLTILATYDNPGVFPIGLFHDQKTLWNANASGKIFRNSMTEQLKVEKVFIFPDDSFNSGKQLSAFTLEDGRAWMAYEGDDKILSKVMKEMQEAQP